MGLEEMSSAKCFGGSQKVFKHHSSELKCDMKFGVYVPPISAAQKVPVLYWLSGLTCTEQNFITKAGAQRTAAEQGIMIVAPDTSPRSCGVEGEDDSYDFGTGAGFYVDATEENWKTNYRMFSYVTKEVKDFNQSSLTFFLQSVSAFSPICNPVQCPWGQKALTGYLGSDKETWKEYDATELVKNYDGPIPDILIDQGTDDQFYPSQLLPENFVEACRLKNVPVTLRMQEGYDHSYYFISSFVEDHVKHHARHLKEYDATELVKNYDGPIPDILIDQGTDDQFYPSQLLPENFVEACRSKNVPVTLRMQEGYDHSYYFISSFVEDHVKHHARHLKA
ncbi:PREDICTED: S-formylglutathione hydrolase-like [Acropora digitifera]|uniref:S-formylglutathione hydrolase-like n=1 Tax=Acropora digitifera TaxID=70779 RepID=UPI00077A8C9A|nr:PREDICTED: S-formylglutathione hydrolase-like [Acropora digitifera]